MKEWFKKELKKEEKYYKRNSAPLLSSVVIIAFIVAIVYFVSNKVDNGFIPYTCEITQSNALLSSNVVNDLNQCFTVPLGIKKDNKQEWCKNRIKQYMKQRYFTGGLHSYRYGIKLGTCE